MKKIKPFIYNGLTVLFFCLIIYYVYKNVNTLTLYDLFKTNLLNLLLLFLCSLLLLFCSLAIEFANWVYMLRKISQISIPIRELYSIFSLANISKYIPGNFAQFVVKNVLVNKYNIPHSKILFVSFLELFYVLSTSMILVIILFVKEGIPAPYLKFIDKFNINYILAIGVIILILFVFLLYIVTKRKWINFEDLHIASKLSTISKLTVISVPVYIVSLTLFGLSIVAGYFFLGNSVLTFDNVVLIILVSTSAFVLGSITPGAPAGIGVREGVFLLLLGSVFNKEITLLAISINRLACISNDVLFYLVSLIFKRRKTITVVDIS